MKLRLKYVHEFVDRHGKRRFYYRYAGQRYPLPDPGPLPIPSAEFVERYNELAEGSVQAVLTRVRRSAGVDGLVYIVGYGDYVKIGFTTDLQKRLSALQTSCPEKLKVLHTFRGRPSNEGALHKSFHSSRLSGEWFRLSGPIAEWIGEQRLALVPQRDRPKFPAPASDGRAV